MPITKTPFSIGGPTADLNIESDFVDDWHAVLQNNQGVISVADVRSTNGVFLKIENELTLEDHDQIAIGDQRFIFRSTWDLPQDLKRTNVYGAVPPEGARLIQIFEGGAQGSVWFIESKLLITSSPPASPTNCAYIKDASISSPHASILLTGEGYVINDMNSASDIFIRLSSSVELFDGDTFLIANTPISLRYP